jgi:dipeptidyl aminopeptidase/acylaminoacyl peptidase
MNSKIVFILSFFLSVACSCNTKTQNETGTYLTEKKRFHSNLLKKGKAPQAYENLANSNEVLKVEYPSNGIKLQALLLKKNTDPSKRKPVLVFLHGGFALGEQDLSGCEVFTKQGFIVFAPSYRGENGNEGNFELFSGEVEDAKAAVKWIAKQPFADSTKNLCIWTQYWRRNFFPLIFRK